MVNIAHKDHSYRVAIAATSVTVSSFETIKAVLERSVPKGDVLECSRVAGLFAVKHTASVIPDCHPIPIEYTAIRHRIEGQTIHIETEVHTIYKTGVEVEAMHAAMITAITIYDMLKPIDTGIVIGETRLLLKTGGKSGLRVASALPKTAVIVCSDSISEGAATDQSGKVAIAKLEALGIFVAHFKVISDDPEAIRNEALSLIAEEFELLLFSGGTGLGPRDHTPDVLAALIDRPIPGIMEKARAYGQAYTPMAMLSRGIAGFAGNALIITLPGSTKGVIESMNAIFPAVLHVFAVRKGDGHG